MSQVVISPVLRPADVEGERWPAPTTPWYVYYTMSDGRSLRLSMPAQPDVDHTLDVAIDALEQQCEAEGVVFQSDGYVIENTITMERT